MTMLVGEKRYGGDQAKDQSKQPNAHRSYCVGLPTKTVGKGECHLLSIELFLCLDLAERTNLSTMEDRVLERALVRVHNELQLVEFYTGAQEI
jgi:hypothetical protein